MKCFNCQNELPNDAQFCSRCGRATPHQATTIVRGGDDTGDATIVRATADLHADRHADRKEVDPLLGVVLDRRYKIEAPVGHGGMGTVYRARRLSLGDEVAVKVLHRQFVAQAPMLERFRREAQAAAMLHHPNVVAIYDFGDGAGESADGGAANAETIPAYIVMELLRGETLGDLLRRGGALTPPRAVRLMREACAGVGAAHARGIVHRDLKPDNIIVLPHHDPTTADDDEARESIKVVDFGIAKLRDMTGEAAAKTNLTQVGTLLGTPNYMSPEQCRGEHLDARSDVYSLGAILYELLTGRPPFTAPSANGVIAKHLTEVPPPLRLPTASIAGGDLARRLDDVIRRALSKDPRERQPDATGFARELAATMRAKTLEANRTVGDETIVSAAPPPFTLAGTTPRPVQPLAVPTQKIVGEEEVIYEAAPPPPKRSALGTALGLGGVAIGAALLAALWWMFATGGEPTVNRNANRPAPRPRPTATPSAAASPSPSPSAILSPTPTPDPLVTPTVQPTLPNFDPVRTAGEVRATLNGWVETTRRRQIDQHMNYYAPELDAYYRRRRTSRDTVRAERDEAFDRYDDVDVRITNTSIQLDDTGRNAVATFDKTWRFEGDDVSRGKVRQQLDLRKLDDDRWVITAERDLRVYDDQNSEP